MPVNREVDKSTGIIKEDFDLSANGSTLHLHVRRPLRDSRVEGVAYLAPIGWTETRQSVAPMLNALAVGNEEHAGVMAASFTHEWSGAPKEVMTAGKRRAERIAYACKFLQENYDYYGIAPHSLAGIDSTRAYIDYGLAPRVFSPIASAGLIQGDNLRRVAPGVFKEILRQEQHFRENFVNESKFAVQSIMTVLRNPILAGGEALYAAQSYVAHHIDTIYDNGTVVGLVIPTKDSIFPFDKVMQSTNGLKIDRKYEIDACHNPTYHNPLELAAFLLSLIDDYDDIIALRSDERAIEAELFFPRSA